MKFTVSLLNSIEDRVEIAGYNILSESFQPVSCYHVGMPVGKLLMFKAFMEEKLELYFRRKLQDKGRYFISLGYAPDLFY